MKKLSFAVAALAVVVASCTSAVTEDTLESETPTEVTAATLATPAPTMTQAGPTTVVTPSDAPLLSKDLAGTTTTTSAPVEEVAVGPPPEGPSAPDFTLALGEDGSEFFTLSQETKPVFMIFWAEW